MTTQKTAWIFIFLLLVGLFIGEAIALHGFAVENPGTADFFARWYGGKELVLHGRNPYDREIDREAQKIMFGHYSSPDEDQVNFAYPLYTVYLFFPLTFVPYAWAQAIWMTVLQFALIALTALTLHLSGWRPSLGILAATILWGIFFYPGARAIMLGQFSILVSLAVMAAVWGLLNGREGPGGAVLALATVKPQMVFLVIPFLLLWAWRRKKWRFITGFGIALAGLIVTSLIWVPDWIFRFVGNLGAYSQYVGFGNPLENLTARFAPGFDHLLNPLVTAALLGLLLYLWYRALTAHPDEFLWAFSWTLLIGSLIAFRSATANHVILYLPLMFIFKRLYALKRGAFWTLAAQWGLTFALWTIFLTTIDKTRADNFEAVFMHGLLPAALILVYLLDWRGLKQCIRRPA
jgi:hypothetical protein